MLVGHAGLLSVAQAAFFGLGAYTSALLATRLAVPLVPGVVCGIAVAAAASAALAAATARVKEDYLAVATLAFQFVVVGVVNNWSGLTRGPLGIPGIPRGSLMGLSLGSDAWYAVLAAGFAACVLLAVGQMADSRYGRLLHAIREDEVFAKSLGKDTGRAKVIAFMISAAIAAAAGSLYAHYVTFVDPSSFDVGESILILAMVVVGGAGSFWGPTLGACTLVLLPEALRFVGLPDSLAANIRQVVYGALLIVVMIIRPQGLAGRYAFARRP